MNLRQARKLGARQKQRRTSSASALSARQDSYSPAQLLRAAAVLYRSWRRACPRRPGGGRSTGLDLPHDDYFAGNRIACLHDRAYYVRRARPPRSAYRLAHADKAPPSLPMIFVVTEP